MAFDSDNLYISSAGFGELNNKLICYKSDDPIATILAANYFPVDILINIGDVMSVMNGDSHPTWVYVTAISPQITTLEIPATAIPALTISTAMLQSLCVTDAKINDVNGSKIALASIPIGAYGVGSISSTDIGDVNGTTIIPATIPAGKFIAGSIATADVAALAITDSKLATGIDGTKITAASIPAGSYAVGGIVGNDIASAAITNIKLASDRIIFMGSVISTATATNVFSTPGTIPGDMVFAMIGSAGLPPSYVIGTSSGTDQVTVHYSVASIGLGVQIVVFRQGI